MTDKLRENLGKALECELRELLRTKEAPYMDLAEACQSAARAALAAAPQPAPDPLRETDVPHMHPMEVMARNFRAKLRAALAAPQPAPAPAADERDEIERIICDAFTCDLRGRGDEDGAFWQTAADALLAAGYRKADALLAERDALIHDIERAKESESALLAELEQARGIVRQGSRVNSDWFQRRDHMAPSRHSKKPGSCTFGPSTS